MKLNAMSAEAIFYTTIEKWSDAKLQKKIDNFKYDIKWMEKMVEMMEEEKKYRKIR